jgi:hypothetical protein
MLFKICAPVALMDQSGRFLNCKSRFDSVREHHLLSAKSKQYIKMLAFFPWPVKRIFP